MTLPARATEPRPVEGCALDSSQFGEQLRRYRRLSVHATTVVRTPGEVRVEFDEGLPAGLLERTLDVERRCCPFVLIAFDARERVLTLGVQSIDQDPRLDSLFFALAPPGSSADERAAAPGRELL
jgi:hypothetical protein